MHYEKNRGLLYIKNETYTVFENVVSMIFMHKFAYMGQIMNMQMSQFAYNAIGRIAIYLGYILVLVWCF